jgi:hypothetical protein
VTLDSGRRIGLRRVPSRLALSESTLYPRSNEMQAISHPLCLANLLSVQFLRNLLDFLHLSTQERKSTSFK